MAFRQSELLALLLANQGIRDSPSPRVSGDSSSLLPFAPVLVPASHILTSTLHSFPLTVSPTMKPWWPSGLSLAALWVCLFPLCLALFEDQAFKFDWRQQLVGKADQAG